MSEITAEIAASGSDFRVGKVLRQSLSVLLKHFATFFLLVFVATIPTMVLTLVVGAKATIFGYVEPNMAGKSPLLNLAYYVSPLLCFPISQAAIYYGTFQHIRDRPFHLGAGLSRAFMRYPAVLGTTVFYTVAFGLGLILLIVPGVMLAISLSLSFPVCVIEELGPKDSVNRSAALTKGHRWKIFGVFVVMVMVGAIVSSLVGIISEALVGRVASILIGFICNAIISALYSIAMAVMYHDLRVLKEGIDIDRIAAVFD